MGKAAAKSTTTTSAQGELEQLIDTSARSVARNQIIMNLLGLGWRLAIAVLMPLLIGVQVDKRFDAAPTYALTGFVCAIILAGYIIYREYQHIQSAQQQDTKAITDAKDTKHTKGHA